MSPTRSETDNKFLLEKILYSELSGLETMDGIAYGMITNIIDFNNLLESLHFEYLRNNVDEQMKFVVTE